jgi:hypothetical protein
MTKPLRVVASLLSVLGLAGVAAARGQEAPPRAVKSVELVLALDTSSSMSGLIDAARQKLWDVVTLLGKAQPRPELRVGLIAYGNTGYDAKVGWVRIESDLTGDLDTVYGKLFALTTRGGDEYVARAVQTATRKLSWSQVPDKDALRIIFVAGNESANQDPLVKLEDAISDARQRGIFVNTIFCGPERAGDAVGWAHAASLGRGQFAAIDHNHTVAIATPHDAELRRLSEELNKTYVAYGSGGAAHAANQAAQDKNAAATSAPAAAARAAGKASGLYDAGEWDLVDASATRGRDVRTMSADELPGELRDMKPDARAAYVAEKAKKRVELQQRIQAANTAREHYIAEERRKPVARPAASAPTATPASPPPRSFDDAVLGGLKSEAEQKGFKF